MRSLARVATAAAILTACALPATSAQAAPLPADPGGQAPHGVPHTLVGHLASEVGDTVSEVDDLLGGLLAAAGVRS
ncbi:hypothetical protein ACFVFQ_07235 [Streptomyces sp. NPDC057743]|uniref:hypothetical protein n=1 Tax=Streptomyces sp. NPDC057743 TaxID=3346236 RepID=UPI0036AAB851